MKTVRTFTISAAVALAALSATPAYACITGPYAGTPPTSHTGTVSPTTHLGPDSTIYSPNGVYKLIFEKTGNLALYKNGNQLQWTSNSKNCIPTPNVAFAARFQSDGNFVVYWHPSNNPFQLIPIWSTNTHVLCVD
eukprot:Opistho-1_new@91298